VRGVVPGAKPRVTVEGRNGAYEVEARLVVGVDGRASMVRQWAGFTTRNDPAKLLFAGVLFDRVPAPVDEFYHVVAPGRGLTALIFPQHDGHARTYFGFHLQSGVERLQGGADMPRYRALSHEIGVPEEFYADAKPIGPLSTFDGADSWVEHPYHDGVALVGDAASTSDPTWGQGMSLTLRDARVLRDALLADDDWDRAGHAYAAEHDRYYAIVRRADGWYADLFMELGPVADERRARALPLLAADPSRAIDVGMAGPEALCDEAARQRFFGEA
jgi:2-polyprenyl-6-methoxyphenol hydroxylase-like FAD-dependent oxidoreductase